MTTRRWMIAVAVVGLAMGGDRLERRRDDFLVLAQYHAAEEAFRRGVGRRVRHPLLPRMIEHAAALARKYRHAARHPWLPVAPDRPEPR
jgi:hypothetical protein